MKTFRRTLRSGSLKIEYTHEVKNVKNINMRVTPEKGLCVSSPPDTSVDSIEKFLLSKLDRILPALTRSAVINTAVKAPKAPAGGRKAIVLGGKTIEYELTYKKIKNIILSVHIKKGVRVSAPIRAKQEDIDRFLHKNEEFILSSIRKQQLAAEKLPPEKEYKTGEYIYFLGQKLSLAVYSGARNFINISGSKMNMFVTDPHNFSLKKYVFEEFLRAECSDYVTALCGELYPRFRKKGIPFPDKIKFRKMVSCWGNCRSQKRILTFSTYLIQLPPNCIEAVVCHEFTHFLHQNHSKDFYSQLTEFMPDWKVYDKIMKAMQNEIIFR
ncbi:MAG: M48 family metallopeptidase [Oscillospiraceae bacterium]|nr:M48 family metallopeptidase [Oscillospiraceae bacterium]